MSILFVQVERVEDLIHRADNYLSREVCSNDAATRAAEGGMNMGVYIKGMEMPKHCSNCEWMQQRFPGGKNWCKRTGELVHETWTSAKSNPIPESCPLVSIPSHGRLIDADALRQSLKDSIDECNNWADEIEGGEMYARVSQALGTFVECSLRVKAAPTIIQAEEE